MTAAERAELVKLRRENAKLRVEREIFKKAAPGLSSGTPRCISTATCPEGSQPLGESPDDRGRCEDGEPMDDAFAGFACADRTADQAALSEAIRSGILPAEIED